MIHPPKFWQQEKGFLSTLLWPLSKLYELVVYINSFRIATKKVKVPVICIGNLTLGGAGKTPTAMAIARALKEEKIKVHFVSRGYGRKSTNIKQVDLNTDTSETVGDEPLLLAQVAPTWVSPDRATAIDMAHQQGADVVILDDGLQNKSLHKDLSILVVDVKLGFGNGCVFPAGPLRVSMEQGLRGVGAVLMVGASELFLSVIPAQGGLAFSKADCRGGTQERFKFSTPRFFRHFLGPRSCKNTFFHKVFFWSGMTVNRDEIPPFTATPILEIPKEIMGKKVIAFAGIAYPSKFFEGLKSAGIEILEECPFPDHHTLSEKEFQGLLEKSKKYKAPLVTTQKDFMRLLSEKHSLVTPIPYHLELEDSFIQFMKQKTNALIQKPL